jgi:AraC-like DNA-binding protein
MKTNRSVNLIALDVGYDNLVYFSSLFRKIEGISPANFRLSILTLTLKKQFTSEVRKNSKIKKQK